MHGNMRIIFDNSDEKDFPERDETEEEKIRRHKIDNALDNIEIMFGVFVYGLFVILSIAVIMYGILHACGAL